jgi:ABC-type lipoprotein export system ATPase subunit
LITRPRLVLADEPTGQLDQATASVTIDALIGWAQHHGSALLVATHDPRVAEHFDQVWQMDHGTLTTQPPATMR